MNVRLPTRTDSWSPRVAPAAVREVLRSEGRPLDSATRARMEPRFGHDFSQVRVHTGERAAQSAGEVDAAAYTTGRNIVFAHGRYAPASSAGERLLAHELAHTIQQGNATAAGALPVSEVHSGAEVEAERAAGDVAAGRSVSVGAGSGAAVARQPAGAAEPPAAPDDRAEVEQALGKFLKQVKHADPKHPLAANQRVWTEAMRLAAASRPVPRPGPVQALGASDRQAKMEQLLKSPLAPPTPEGLAHAIVAILPGPVDAAELEHLKSLSVFRESQPTGPAGVAKRFGDLAPADMPAPNAVEADEQRKQDLAMSKQRSNPTLSPPLDPSRVYGAFAGGREKDKPEFVNPPVPKAEEAERPGVVNRDIRLPSSLPALSVDRSIHFRVNEPGAVASSDAALRAALAPEGAGDLDRVTGWLRRWPEFSAQLTGMASVEGPPGHNQQLSENRVRSIAGALLRAGIDASRIADVPGKPERCARVSFGMFACGADGGSKTVDPKDRQVRVRLFVTPKGPEKP